MTPNLFVISPCFLENIDCRLKAHYRVLHLFTENDYMNVAIDRNNKLLTLYEEIAIKQKDQIIIGWLNLMSKLPESFKRIVDIQEEISNNEELCLYVCKHINQSKKPMIVWDRQEYSCYTFNDDNEINHDGCFIWFINWNEMDELLKKPTHEYYNCGDGIQVGGNVSESTIKIEK